MNRNLITRAHREPPPILLAPVTSHCPLIRRRRVNGCTWSPSPAAQVRDPFLSNLGDFLCLAICSSLFAFFQLWKKPSGKPKGISITNKPRHRQSEPGKNNNMGKNRAVNTFPIRRPQERRLNCPQCVPGWAEVIYLFIWHLPWHHGKMTFWKVCPDFG